MKIFVVHVISNQRNNVNVGGLNFETLGAIYRDHYTMTSAVSFHIIGLVQAVEFAVDTRSSGIARLDHGKWF